MSLKNNICFFAALGGLVMCLNDICEAMRAPTSTEHLDALHERRTFFLPSEQDDLVILEKDAPISDRYDLYYQVENILGSIGSEVEAAFFDGNTDYITKGDFSKKFKKFIELISKKENTQFKGYFFYNISPDDEEDKIGCLGIISSLIIDIRSLYYHHKDEPNTKKILGQITLALHNMLMQCDTYKTMHEKDKDDKGSRSLYSYFKELLGLPEEAGAVEVPDATEAAREKNEQKYLPADAHGELVTQLPNSSSSLSSNSSFSSFRLASNPSFPLSSDSSASLGSDSSPARFSDAENKDPMTENFKFEALKQKEQESLPADGTLSKNDRDEIIRYLKDLKPECDYRNNNGAKRPNSAPASNNRFNKKSRRNDLKTKRTKSVGSGRQRFSRDHLSRENENEPSRD